MDLSVITRGAGDDPDHSHLKPEKPMDGFQNPGVGVTSGPQKDHVEGVVIVIRRRDECW